MKKNEMLKKAIAVAAVTTMVITSAGMVFAASFTDIDGHWAKERIITWSEDGVVNGYPDESFRPNNSITRAEFMSLIDKAFELTEEAEIAYPDVDENAWYYDLVKRAQAQGYISGYDDGTMKPENPITRQEAAAIVTRIMELEKNAEKIVQFLDHEGFQDWGKGYIGAAAKARYMNGDDQGNFRALDNITRAEAVTVLDNIFYGENHDEDEIVVEAEYGFVVTGDSYTVGELTTPEDQDFEGKEAITIKLEEIVAGTAFEG
ncbi:MAG: S-layer homology domain-containing protein, partial [Clostridiaceae bacterium]|nr:S-layer homology domain-containing protein [Clostridiaceae bacterium]